MINAQVESSSALERQRFFKLRLAQKGIVASQVEPIRRHKSTTAALSYAQQRLWFLEQLESGNAAYNLSSAVQLSGHFELPIMARVLNEIVRRHEILRTTITDEDGRAVQVIHPARQVPLQVVDLPALSSGVKAAEARQLANGEAMRPFDLRRGPLLRITVLRLAAQEHVGLFTMHHFVTDGWSMEVLVKEFATVYETFTKGRSSPLDELAIQYADFAEWQREKLSGSALNSHLSYWKTQLSGSNGLLELPFDRPRPLVQTYHGGHLSLSLPVELSNDLRSLTQREGCTLFMTLLAAFQILLYRYTGKRNVNVGIAVAGRGRPEVQDYQLIFYTLVGLLIFLMPRVTGVDTKTLTGFTLALFYLLIPLGDILVLFPSLARANIAMDKINSLGLSLSALPNEESRPTTPAVTLDQLELADVTHSYHRHSDNKSFLLGPIDLTFQPGELIFLVGGNGSGKTTLAKLICGLYTPESGEVRLNNETVTDENIHSYRQPFSVVFSDFHLFENLLGLDAKVSMAGLTITSSNFS